MEHSYNTIFREYDIRGTVGDEINEKVVFSIGAAYGERAKQNGAKTVSAGRDCRLSSEALSAALVDGITSRGVNVSDIGLVSTPMLYFSVFNRTPDGGVIVTASHNPPEYNGLKLCMGKNSMFGDDIKALAAPVEAKSKHARGKVTKAEITEQYADFLTEGVKVERGLDFVFDCGNGAGGVAAPLVFEKLGLRARGIFTEPDGNFPNHHPDPSVDENLKDLIKEVRGGGGRLGMAFDGDADRLGVVDENGNTVRGDMLVLIFALNIAAKTPGATVIGDVKCSRLLFELAARAGAKTIMWKTGHSLMKKKLADEKAELAGEMSGHIFFGDRFPGYDDALYAGLRLLEIVSEEGKPVSGLLEGVPELFSAPEIRVDCPDERKFKVAEAVKAGIAQKFAEAEITEIDGVRAGFPGGWGLVRASNTQPALVMRFEAESEKRLSEIRGMVEEIVAGAVGG
ncbi:MAG: phosphomannomutase/phosphoglucomutase [Thermodesulfobacteriota bacterium]